MKKYRLGPKGYYNKSQSYDTTIIHPASFDPIRTNPLDPLSQDMHPASTYFTKKYKSKQSNMMNMMMPNRAI